MKNYQLNDGDKQSYFVLFLQGDYYGQHYDFTACTSPDDAWNSEKCQRMTQDMITNGGYSLAECREIFFDSLTAYTPLQVLDAAEDGKDWPVAFGLVTLAEDEPDPEDLIDGEAASSESLNTNRESPPAIFTPRVARSGPFSKTSTAVTLQLAQTS